MIAINKPFTNLQIELLKLYSTNISEIDLFELKNILAEFYAKKSIKYANKAWEAKKLTNKDMDDWLNEKQKKT